MGITACRSFVKPTLSAIRSHYYPGKKAQGYYLKRVNNMRKKQILEIMKENMFSSYDMGNIEDGGIGGAEKAADAMMILWLKSCEEIDSIVKNVLAEHISHGIQSCSDELLKQLKISLLKQ